MKSTKKKSSRPSPSRSDQAGDATAQLKEARLQIEALGSNYRQLIKAYRAVTDNLSRLGVSIPTSAVEGCNLEDSNFQLGLMAMNGFGPVQAVGRCHWLTHKLLAESSLYEGGKGGCSFADDIPF